MTEVVCLWQVQLLNQIMIIVMQLSAPALLAILIGWGHEQARARGAVRPALGYCLVGTATRGDRHLVAVVMHSDLGMTTDVTRLLDYGFSTSLQLR